MAHDRVDAPRPSSDEPDDVARRQGTGHGWTSGAGFNDPNSPALTAEMWDPATGAWTDLAAATVPRLYHSIALLLPDGRVLTTGGNGFTQTEIYSPPYLFAERDRRSAPRRPPSAVASPSSSPPRMRPRSTRWRGYVCLRSPTPTA